MRHLTVITLVALAAACSSSEADPYEQAATEVEQMAAALQDADRDADIDRLARRGGDRDRRHHHHRGLLNRFGDSEAFEACRALADDCGGDGADAGAGMGLGDCRDEVRGCVRDALREAFAAMCEERSAMCAEDGAPERPCGRIARVCEGGGRFPGGGFGKHGDGGVGFDPRGDAGFGRGHWHRGGDRGRR
ncbi:MAG: hypothetical protein OXT09_15100 [Myxococcales bacterium]|nr:hypothetical protein [Myxococcales bacterium]